MMIKTFINSITELSKVFIFVLSLGWVGYERLTTIIDTKINDAKIEVTSLRDKDVSAINKQLDDIKTQNKIILETLLKGK